LIEANKISYSIGANPILANVSFLAEAGEVLVILGGNGAGKSTLLKIISGDIVPGEGSINICGKDIAAWTPQELSTFRAILQQNPVLSMSFSVREVVMMGRYPHFKGKESPLDHAIADAALKKAGIDHLAERNFLYLSGGEQQRVHLARVFAQIWQTGNEGPRYLFMDEPVNSLDIRHQHSSLELAREFAADGNCVVAVLHDLNLAIQYADKILLLRKGRVMASGTPEDVMQEHILSAAYDYPLSIFSTSHYKHPVVVPLIQN
jgi:iron complex transport system ATP-binding protein